MTRQRVAVKMCEEADWVRAQSGAQPGCGLEQVPASDRFERYGEMSEWLKEHAWKTKRESDTKRFRSALTHTGSAT